MLSRSSTITRSSERAAALSRRDTLRPSSRQNKKSVIKKDKEGEKFKVRRAKITRLEQEQMLEDDIAVRLIQALPLSTMMPFDGVQTEFHDLDGLSWANRPLQPRESSRIRTKPTIPHPSRISKHSSRPDAASRGSFTHAELANIAFRLKKELKFPNIAISLEAVAQAAFASLPK